MIKYVYDTDEAESNAQQDEMEKQVVTDQDRLDFYLNKLDDEILSLVCRSNELRHEFSKIDPDQHDWDNTIIATLVSVDTAVDSIKRASRYLREGS